jgi:hypothetical protein
MNGFRQVASLSSLASTGIPGLTAEKARAGTRSTQDVLALDRRIKGPLGANCRHGEPPQTTAVEFLAIIDPG